MLNDATFDHTYNQLRMELVAFLCSVRTEAQVI